MKTEQAYTLGCLSIHLQEDKSLDTRNLGLKLMAAADKAKQKVQVAFSAGRLDTAVALSVRRPKVAEKGGNQKRPGSKRG